MDGGISAGQQALKMLHGVQLIALNADGGLFQAQRFHDKARASDDRLAPLQHEPVVGGDVGLALGAIEDDGVRLADGTAELDVGGESRAAHTRDTGLLDNVDDFLTGQGIHIVPVDDRGVRSIFEIVFDHHGHHHVSTGMGPGLDGHDLTGDAGVDRRAKTGDLADLLSHGDLVPHGYNGLAGCAHMHRHGDYHLCRSFLQRYHWFALRGLLVFGGVDAAIKLMVHSITSVITSQLYAFPHDSLRSLMRRLDAALTHEAFESLL